MNNKIKIILLGVIAGTSLLAMHPREVASPTLAQQLRVEAGWNEHMSYMMCVSGEVGTEKYFQGRAEALMEVAHMMDGQ